MSRPRIAQERRPLSITRDPETIRALESRATDGVISAALHRLVARYEELIRRAAPPQSDDEVAVCADALRATHVEPWAIAHLSEEIEEALDHRESDLTGGNEMIEDGRVEVEKMRARLPRDYAGQLALLDLVDRWWVTNSGAAV